MDRSEKDFLKIISIAVAVSMVFIVPVTYEIHINSTHGIDASYSVNTPFIFQIPKHVGANLSYLNPLTVNGYTKSGSRMNLKIEPFIYNLTQKFTINFFIEEKLTSNYSVKIGKNSFLEWNGTMAAANPALKLYNSPNKAWKYISQNEVLMNNPANFLCSEEKSAVTISSRPICCGILLPSHPVSVPEKIFNASDFSFGPDHLELKCYSWYFNEEKIQGTCHKFYEYLKFNIPVNTSEFKLSISSHMYLSTIDTMNYSICNSKFTANQ
ncbi:MAG: hypothetical protein ACYCR9_09725 [Cuniculiplasma sp.]